MNPYPSINRTELRASRQSVRLQKILADAGTGSRRACEKLIAEGRVRVNGVVVNTPGSKAVPDTDNITVDGRPVEIPQKKVFVFNKPRNVVTTMFDPEGRKCVGDYLRDIPYRLYPVGRLDYDVSGLLILTNDGDYANRLMHPRYGIVRTYHARVKNILTEKSIKLLCKGIHLKDGFARASSVRTLIPATSDIKLLGNPRDNESLVEIKVSEGRKHFVKNILEAVNCPVVKLSRVAYGPYTLKGIKTGTLRQIAHKEELFG
jgi:23S rRNA pseudouridine2605 synthase